MFYASFGLLSIVIHIIINYEIMKIPKSSDGVVKRRYRSFLFGVLIYYVSDVLWGFLYDARIVPFVYADTVVYFAAMGLSLFLWMRFIDAYTDNKSIWSKILTLSGWMIFCFQIVMLIVNIFTSYMFYFDKDGEYFPMPGRYIALTLQVVLFILLSVYTMVLSIKEKDLSAQRYRAIAVSGLVMTGFIIFQTQFPLLPFYAIGCLIATCIIHTFVVAGDKAKMNLKYGSVKQLAYRDALTNVKNNNAYTEAKDSLDIRIHDEVLEELGIAVFDVNDLKLVNDTMGHDEGDRYLREACSMICNVFKHSPVYRVGGDEFVVLLEGEDYQNREMLMEEFDKKVEENLQNGGAVVSGGMDVFVPGDDFGFDSVFRRADARMYERKTQLKKKKEDKNE